MPRIHLYTSWRSSSSGRLRIALALKSLDFTPHFVHLNAGAQHSQAYRRLNPLGTVPCFVVHHDDPPTDEPGASNPLVIPQSVSALEYIDALAPSPALYPHAPAALSHVRTLISIIASDTQPLQNRRIFRLVNSLGGCSADWARNNCKRGLEAYETMIQNRVGKYSVGDEICAADVVLVPQVWNAEMYGVDMQEFPLVRGVVERMMELKGVRAAHWRMQGDTPEEFRGLGSSSWPRPTGV